MAALYGRHYNSRYRAIAQLIASRSSVLEVCCGPGILYRRYLRGKSVNYTGFDINPNFIKTLIHVGAQAEVRDLCSCEKLPSADYVIIQASLYHFLPTPKPIVDRMFAAAKTALIIAEPIRNLSNFKLSVVRSLACFLTNPGVGAQPLRFTEYSFDKFIADSFHTSVRAFFVSGGREKVYRISK